MWTPGVADLPPWLEHACASGGLSVRRARVAAEVFDAARRTRPVVIILDGSSDRGGVESVVAALKRDGYTRVVPCVLLSPARDVVRWLGLGADEVIDPAAAPPEPAARFAAALRRSERDLAAQPTTRLPGASAIDGELEARIAVGAKFAACYADLDHFKEYNDRYGFREGDRVIRMTAVILHDAAVALAGAHAFVGHIGGDDFILVLPLDHAAAVCHLAIEVFDTLAPLQYSEADRRAGYYFGKDRRGQLHRVPLMTLSVGATSNERRRLTSAAEVGRLASEMKSFAKARAGSVYAVDRRGAEDTLSPVGSAGSESPST